MAEPLTILIVDDSESIVTYLVSILKNEHHNILYTYSKDEALKIIQRNDIDILICDLLLPEREDGLETIRFFKQMNADSKVLGISANSQIENVIAVMKEGADDFVQKTSTKDQIIEKIDELKRSLLSKDDALPEMVIGEDQDVLVGQSKQIRAILEKLQIIANSDVESCLISGESGTGKELIARTIHKLSSRKNGPLIALNCAGIPENLFDSELFGFEKGSFTGAYQTNIGKFELADKGILFLDEISEMPLHLQGKLLRVLENREVLRIGGRKTIPINTMILAATNQDLVEKIYQGLFREDIYYRLNMVKIHVPPVRERKDDISLLVEHFLKVNNSKLEKNKEFSEGALKLLQNYSYPGNVRELKNIIYNAVLFSSGNLIAEKDIQSYMNHNSIQKNHSTPNIKRKSNQVDDEMVLKILQKHDGNISKAAQELGYSREGLSRKLKRMESKN